MGRNYFKEDEFSIKDFVESDGKKSVPTLSDICVFVSYRRLQPDQKIAREIADILTGRGFDVFFDDDNTRLQQAVLTSSHHSIAMEVEYGLRRSNALISIHSEKTYSSAWTSYEVGFARAHTDDPALRVAHLITEQVKEIPAFVLLGRQILDHIDFNEWVSEIGKYRREQFKTIGRITESQGKNMNLASSRSRYDLKYLGPG